MASRRRSSILKSTKINLDDDEDQERQGRKVRFSSNFVKPYTTEENTTVWDRTYEEPIQDSSSKDHSDEKVVGNTSNIKWTNLFSDTSNVKMNLSDFFNSNKCIPTKTQSTEIKEKKNLNFVSPETTVDLAGAGIGTSGNERLRFSSKREEIYCEGIACLNNTTLIGDNREFNDTTPGFCSDQLSSGIGSCRTNNKTALGEIEMEFTEAVTGFQIEEPLVGNILNSKKTVNISGKENRAPLFARENEFNSTKKTNKTVLDESTMDFTKAVSNVDIEEPLMGFASKRNKTVFDETAMEITEAVPNFCIEEDLAEHVFKSYKGVNKNKTVLQETAMDITRAVPNMVIEEDLAGHAFKFDKKENAEGNKTILQESTMEFTKAVSNFVMKEDLAEHASKSDRNKNRNKTVFGDITMDITEAVSNYNIEEDLVGHAFKLNEKGNKNKTVLQDNTMDFTKGVPNFVIEEDLAGHAFKLNKNENTNRNKTVLQENTMEFTNAVPHFAIEEDLAGHAFKPNKNENTNRNKTVLQDNTMEFTKAVSNFAMEEDLAGHAFKTNQIEHKKVNKTVFEETAMEITEAVPNFAIEEDLAGFAFESNKKEDAKPNKTVLQENPMEFANDVASFKSNKDNLNRNKTVLQENTMEFTKAITNYSPEEPLLEVALNLNNIVKNNENSQKNITTEDLAGNVFDINRKENEMDFKESPIKPTLKVATGKNLTGHAFECNENANEIISKMNEIEFIGGKTNSVVLDKLESRDLDSNEIANGNEERMALDVSKQNETFEIIPTNVDFDERKFPFREIKNIPEINIIDSTNVNLKNIQCEDSNEYPEKNCNDKLKDATEEFDKTSRRSIRNKHNFSSFYSKSLLMQNQLIENALSSGKKTASDELSYDEFPMNDFSNILAGESSNVPSKLRELNSRCGSFNIFEDVSAVDLHREANEILKTIALNENDDDNEIRNFYDVPSFSHCRNSTQVVDITNRRDCMKQLQFSNCNSVEVNDVEKTRACEDLPSFSICKNITEIISLPEVQISCKEDTKKVEIEKLNSGNQGLCESYVIQKDEEKGRNVTKIDPLPEVQISCSKNAKNVEIEKLNSGNQGLCESYAIQKDEEKGRNVTKINPLPEVQISCSKNAKNVEIEKLNMGNQGLCESYVIQKDEEKGRNVTKINPLPEVQINCKKNKKVDDAKIEMLNSGKPNLYVIRKEEEESRNLKSDENKVLAVELNESVHKNETLQTYEAPVPKILKEVECKNKTIVIESDKCITKPMESNCVLENESFHEMDEASTSLSNKIEVIQDSNDKSMIKTNQVNTLPEVSTIEEGNVCLFNVDELVGNIESSFESLMNFPNFDEHLEKMSHNVGEVGTYVNDLIKAERNFMTGLDDLEMLTSASRSK